LNEGLKDVIPDPQKRIDHILHNQVYGIAITQLTALLTRRSVYCSKDASGKYSLSHFDNSDGNIRFKETKHLWENGSCKYCGASKAVQDRGKGKEAHAYEFIHRRIQEIINMRFDVVISNPPYQLSDGGGLGGSSAKPIYNMFVEAAKKLNPKYLVMIIPSRWFAGGKGLDEFRDSMLSDSKIRVLNDYMDAADCFPGVEIKGGVCYFLWNRDNEGKCKVITHKQGKIISEALRPFKEEGSNVFIRYNEAVPIFKKVNSFKEKTFDVFVSTRQPFGFSVLPEHPKDKLYNVLLYQRGGTTYCKENDVRRNLEWLQKPKVLISKAYNAGDSFPHQVINKPFIASSNSACTETYLVIGPFESKQYCENVISYIQTKFFRLLVLLRKSSQNAAKGVYEFVPVQDFSKPWTDAELYKKYGLTQKEIDFIESMIKPMELGGDSNG